jgi:hypothetical protein
MAIPPVAMSREMASDAVEYFMAGRKIAAGEDFYGIIAFYRMPLNFVLAQACELALKSMLASKGWDRKRWNGIRHDLVELMKAVVGENLTLDPEFVRYCEIMGKAHREFDFRYSGEHESPAFIGPAHALEMIEPQIRAIAPFGLRGL